MAAKGPEKREKKGLKVLGRKGFRYQTQGLRM